MKITSSSAGTEEKKKRKEKKTKQNKNGPANGELRREMQPHRRALGRKGPTCPYHEIERSCPQILLGLVYGPIL